MNRIGIVQVGLLVLLVVLALAHFVLFLSGISSRKVERLLLAAELTILACWLFSLVAPLGLAVY